MNPVNEMTVRQRTGGDCIIVSLANALRVSYERAAEMANVHINEAGAACRGMVLTQLIGPLWDQGIAAVHFVSDQLPGISQIVEHTGVQYPAAEKLEHWIKGERAIIAALVCSGEEKRAGHCVGWDGRSVVGGEPYFDGSREWRLVDPRILVEALILLPRGKE